jgi:hypothetical protein
MFHLSDQGTSDLIFWWVEQCSSRFSVYEQAPESVLIPDEEIISLKVDAHSKVVANIVFENAFSQPDFSLVIP